MIIAIMRTGDSPAPVSKGEVERIGLGGLARLVDETVRVEHHGVLVDLRVMHEVPTYSREWLGSTVLQSRVHTRCSL